MKRILSFTMALCTLLFASCEQTGNTPDPETKAKLNRTSAAIMEFNAEGGNGEITYTIENPVTGVQVKAQCTADWIDGLTTGETVTFVVEENTSKESRLATIEVTYGSNCKFEVTVNQKATSGSGNTDGNGGDNGSDGTWYCYCDYFGTSETTVPNYYITLTSLPLDDEGYVPQEAEAYCFDLYSNASVGSTIVVPNGTYNFDADDTTTANTFGNYYSCYFPAYENALYFTAGVITISDNKLVANVTTEDGKVHNVTYEGSLVCEDYSDYTEEEGGNSGDESGSGGSGGPDDYYYSNLTEDYSFNISVGNSYGYADFYGDCYGLGLNNFYIDLYEDGVSGNGLDIFIDILTTATATDIVGTYTPYYTSESEEYTFVEGYADEEGYLGGSWIATVEDWYIADGPLAPLALGSVTIAATSQEDVYTVTLNCTDDAGNAITGTFTSTLEFTDCTEEVAAAPAKVSKKATTITKKVARTKDVVKHRFARR